MTEAIENNLSQDAQDFIQRMKDENPKIKQKFEEIEKENKCKSEVGNIKEILEELKEKDPKALSIILDGTFSGTMVAPSVDKFLSKKQKECIDR